MHVVSLWTYPVKSLGGVEVDTAGVERWGLAGDRRWSIIDDRGDTVTARALHSMLGLRAEPVDDLTIRITARDASSIVVNAPVGVARIPVSLARQGAACPADPEAGAWLSKQLGRPVQLVWQDDPTMRSVRADEGGLPGDVLSMADAGPLLLATEASMAQLNAWIAQDTDLPDVPDIDPGDLSDPAAPAGPAALDIRRFRPNVVVDGDEPFAEDSWAGVQIGDVEFRTTMRCDRCVMTTVDPVTLAGGKEPIRTLARHRRFDRKTWFGIRLAPLATGVISVGDAVVAE